MERTERKRNVLTRAKAERQIARLQPFEFDVWRDHPSLAKHPNKHVRAKLEKKVGPCPT